MACSTMQDTNPAPTSITDDCLEIAPQERNILLNYALNIFYIWLYGRESFRKPAVVIS